MRTGKARQLDTTSQPKDYCDSLAQLPGLVEASQQPNAHAPALVPFVLGPEGEADRPKLAVCHDYKVSCILSSFTASRALLTPRSVQGGYTEGGAELRRDYTFNWWQFTDTFI
jgi:hypothetical protein